MSELAITLEQLETIFQGYLKRVPVSLAVRSTMRMVALSSKLPLDSVVLDVGCGDGCFGQLYPKTGRLTLDGIDLSVAETNLARQTGAYRDICVGDISRVVPQGSYDVALGNCSMEHVPDIHQALRNIHSALKPGGMLLLAVPAFGWSRTLRTVRFVESFSTRFGMAASGFIDGFFQHHHLYDHPTWKMVVEGNGFEVVDMKSLGGPNINWIFERELPPAFLEFVFKTAFKRYPNALSFLRRMISREALLEIVNQPIELESPHCIEFLVHAVRK